MFTFIKVLVANYYDRIKLTILLPSLLETPPRVTKGCDVRRTVT